MVKNIFELRILLLGTFWRQRIGSEDTNMKKFSNISIKFAYMFKIFENFCHFLSLSNFWGQRKFSRSCWNVSWQILRTENYCWIYFYPKKMSIDLRFSILSSLSYFSCYSIFSGQNTLSGFLHVLLIVPKWSKCGLHRESFKSFSNDYAFWDCLISLVSLNFWDCLSFWLALFNWLIFGTLNNTFCYLFPSLDARQLPNVQPNKMHPWEPCFNSAIAHHTQTCTHIQRHT